jgi:hypothetical protein
MKNTALFQDPALRRIIVVSTGLAFGAMLGSLAAFRMGHGGALQLRWHWSTLGAMAIVAFWNSRFWRAVWETQDHPSRKATRHLFFYLIALVLLGIGSFLYPIQFVEQSYRNGILKGVLTAAVFLGTLGWLIFTIGKAFGSADSAELDRKPRS